MKRAWRLSEEEVEEALVAHVAALFGVDASDLEGHVTVSQSDRDAGYDITAEVVERATALRPAPSVVRS